MCFTLLYTEHILLQKRLIEKTSMSNKQVN